jgi:hypothetical protein
VNDDPVRLEGRVAERTAELSGISLGRGPATLELAGVDALPRSRRVAESDVPSLSSEVIDRANVSADIPAPRTGVLSVFALDFDHG